MDRSIVECELTEGAVRLQRVRDDLSEVERRLSAATDALADLRLRAVLSETPVAAGQLISAQRGVDTLRRAQERLCVQALALEVERATVPTPPGGPPR